MAVIKIKDLADSLDLDREAMIAIMRRVEDRCSSRVSRPSGR